jgi:hypothetical protein
VDIDAIRARLAKTVDGKWTERAQGMVFDSEGIMVADCRWRELRREDVDHADFIAHARQDIPDLLAEIDRLTALVKVCEGALRGGLSVAARLPVTPNYAENAVRALVESSNMALAAIRGESG